MGVVDVAALMPKEAALEDLRATVTAYNETRPKVAREMHIRILLIFGGYLLASAVVLYGLWTNGKTDLISFAAMLLALLGGVVWKFVTAPAKHFQQTLRDRMLPLIFGFVDELRYVNGATPRFMGGMPGKEFVPRSRAEHGDMITGRHEGLAFTLSETVLTTGSGKSKETTFKGVIFYFQREQEFPGLLLVARKPNAVQRFVRELFWGAPMMLVTSGNPEVDASHEFRTNRADAATPLVQGTLARALDYLATEWRDDVVRLALNGQDCYLLLPTKKDFFELPPVDTPIDFDRYIWPMIRDLVSLLATAKLVSKVG